MLETLDQLAGISGFLIALGSLLYAVYRPYAIKRRASRPEEDDLAQLRARLAAVVEARARFRTVGHYQIHQIHMLAVSGLTMLMVSSVLIVLVILTLAPTDWTRILGAFTAFGAMLAIVWLGASVLRVYEAGVLIAEDFRQVKNIEEHIEKKEALRLVKQTHPLR